jgi:hypothetical protein
VFPACDRAIVGERPDDETVGRVAAYKHGQRTILGSMTRAGAKYFAAVCIAAESERKLFERQAVETLLPHGPRLSIRAVNWVASLNPWVAR